MPCLWLTRIALTGVAPCYCMSGAHYGLALLVDWDCLLLKGRGVLEYANGDRYAGGWDLGRPHGAGMLVKSDGTAEYGTWEHGKHVE